VDTLQGSSHVCLGSTSTCDAESPILHRLNKSLCQVIHTQKFLKRWIQHQLGKKARHRLLSLASWTALISILDFKLRIKYATAIMACWRGYRRFILHLSKCKVMNKVACVCADSIKRHICSQHHRVTEIQHYRVAEAHLAGRSMFKRTRETKIQHQILVQSNVCKRDHNSELQRIFVTYCGYGQKDNTSRLGIGSFLRLLKDSTNVMWPSNNAGLRPSDIELIALKGRTHNNAGAVASHLRYSEFLQTIHILASIYFSSVPSRSDRLTEHDAKTCVFLQQHVFQSKVAKYHTNSLRSLSCVGRVDLQLHVLSQRIISLWRIHYSRVLFNLQKSLQLTLIEKKQRQSSATYIQRVWRGVTSLEVTYNYARGVYDLFVDFESGCEFWFNRRTRVSLWTRPRILLDRDVRKPIFMPSKELIFEALCSKCSASSVVTYCIECRSLYCSQCRLLHSGNHTLVNIEMCVHCHFQTSAYQRLKKENGIKVYIN